MEHTKMEAMQKSQITSLARVLVNKNLKATPEQCAAVYATPAGQRVKALIAALREKEKAALGDGKLC